jgi:dTDP-4-amino-4,6-dideoxygalactose transaminase
VIPYVDLKTQYRNLKPEIDAAIAAVLENAQFVLGPAVESFEERFASYCGSSHAIGVNSGTSALHLALLAAGVSTGDEVITVPFTFVASAAAIEYAGARPVFVDIEPECWTMDPRAIEAVITPRTKAIMPVHLFGQPADMDPILAVASKHGLAVIEDACQAHGADYKGRRCGSLGHIACFSFYPGKNLGAYGEAGAVVTDDAGLAARMRLLRSWGEETRYEHKYRGFNYRMDGLQGAVLGVKLTYLDAWNEARRSHAARYAALLGGSPAVTPHERSGSRHVYHVYAVRVPQRDSWRQRLTEAGIQTGVHYPVPVHLQAAYRDLGYSAGDFPVSERLAGDVLSLPIFPEMTSGQIDTVARLFRAAVPAAAGR